MDCQFYEAKNGMEAIHLIKKMKFDLVFLDVSMPVMNGYETCKEILAMPSPPPLIMLTQHSEYVVVEHFRRFGLSFITKNASVEDIVKAVSITLSGKQFIEGALDQGHERKLTMFNLTDQEKTLIGKLGSGLSSKEIAEQMALKAKTVTTYRERLLKKMKVKNVAEMISLIFRTGNDQG